MDAIGLLRSLSEAVGVSGHEDEVRDLIRELVAPMVDELRVDALGNLIGVRRGRRPEVLLLDAHLDEVGFLVAFVEESGFLRLAPMGGWDARILPAHAVTVRTRDGRHVRGVIGSVPPHVLRDEERNRAVKLDELFVDVGAGSAPNVRALGIRLGDPVVPAYPFEALDDDLVMGKAFDDRAGCAALVRTLEALGGGGDDPELTIAAAFTVHEETGTRGARTAAFQLRPKIALVLEGTTAADVPGVPPARQPAKLGAGPAITIQDLSMMASRPVVDLLTAVAERDGIPHQHKLPGFGGTDAGAIHLTAEGCLAGVLSVPCRYIHSPLSLMRLSDFEATVRLATAFTREAATLLTV